MRPAMTQVSVAQDGISKLLAAEQEAQKIVTAARKSLPSFHDLLPAESRLAPVIVELDDGARLSHAARNMCSWFLTDRRCWRTQQKATA